MPRKRLPEWFKIAKPDAAALRSMEKLVHNKKLHTVCHEANCPNKGTCFKSKSVTFMILGKNCTRNCSFCNVSYKTPMAVDPDEPMHIANAVVELGLKHIVITSVTRDDLEDQGATQFANTIRAIKENSDATVEVLIPDLQGNTEHLKIITDAKPDVIGHNLETIRRLYDTVRPDAVYERSLSVLRTIKELDPAIYTKSGIMVGLGEKTEEVHSLMGDLRAVDCDIFTIGQYLRPSDEHIEIEEYVTPQAFEAYEAKGKELGFKAVAAGPFVRSSFNALEVFDQSKEVD
ncbi:MULTISPECIES: lipoyl synthase [unclassified Fusibacter]|uniref:lipoyl synthase n=1 Tax=unclassified Fusibacter TaxID=2624464 RepID=UPI0010113930|nr:MULTISPECIES: lipoyl synthase [unclassified Fusibacter]MCK8059640.1 lipoyl synthase [Fusibacter sp. A2]NPE21441.1 lipoyl synthase [Fusibacter sp. A1]RXV61853.1 lipoyl synthase [Fusibacter sp. A1]